MKRKEEMLEVIQQPQRHEGASQLQAPAGDWATSDDTSLGATAESFDLGLASDPKQQLDGMTNTEIVKLIRKAGIPG